jgi:hypothetical protein
MASTNTKNRRAAQRRNASTFGRNVGRKPKPQPKGLAKAFGMLPMAKKAAPTKSSARGGGKAGTAAMLTAAAGFAYKNRSKLGGLLGKRRQPKQPA